MVAILEHAAPQARTDAQERRRPRRMSDPSPELIALMRKPTAEVRRQLALYDAPNFVPPGPAVRARANPMRSLRVLCAVGVCIGAWGGMFTAMMVAWG